MVQGKISANISKSKRILSLILFCSAVVLGLSAYDGSDGDAKVPVVPVVQTRSGYISGILDNGTFAYLGIPFAAPPVGEKRWRLPVRENPGTAFGPPINSARPVLKTFLPVTSTI
jgi:para-nitrobenzyl esterase